MTDVEATLFRLRMYLFEYGPFFLAAWLGVALVTVLMAVMSSRGIRLKSTETRSSVWRHRRLGWVRHGVFSLLWTCEREEGASPSFNRLVLFGVGAAGPALVITSLIDTKTLLLRAILMLVYALALGWIVAWAMARRRGKLGGQRPEVEGVCHHPTLRTDRSESRNGGLGYFAQVFWKSFSGQVDRFVIPLMLGFVLASALSIYVPSRAIRPWLGEDAWQGPYLAALMATPLPLGGGTEVALASALLVKGASLGAALSVMLVAAGAVLLGVRRLYHAMSLKTVVLYLSVVWFGAGSLGAIVDGAERLFAR